jgi:hypothetical protein
LEREKNEMPELKIHVPSPHQQKETAKRKKKKATTFHSFFFLFKKESSCCLTPAAPVLSHISSTSKPARLVSEFFLKLYFCFHFYFLLYFVQIV